MCFFSTHFSFAFMACFLLADSNTLQSMHSQCQPKTIAISFLYILRYSTFIFFCIQFVPYDSCLLLFVASCVAIIFALHCLVLYSLQQQRQQQQQMIYGRHRFCVAEICEWIWMRALVVPPEWHCEWFASWLVTWHSFASVRGVFFFLLVIAASSLIFAQLMWTCDLYVRRI